MRNLKRILLVVMTLLTISTTANAQFKWGIKAGLNVNKVHFNNKITQDIWNRDNSCGWTAGLMAEFTVPVIGVCLDASLMYARMNNAADDDINATDTEGEDSGNIFGRNFLEIPVNLKYKFNLPVVGRIVKPMIYTGPTFAFKLDKNTWENMKTKTFQASWNVGIGFEFLNHLQLNGGYSFGMNNVLSRFGANTEVIKAKNSYWTVTAAYLF
ncbi:MAG: PorT family protein [Muribaculaceae bacterium]|nr:PorT family protein [Muribaculaceae bacterium]